MTAVTLEDRLTQFRDPIDLLRDSPAPRFGFTYPVQHTNWQDEQEGWRTAATLLDQTHHMTDVYFRGPDVTRLLADTGTNSFASYRRDKSKHFVACTERGLMVGTAVLFGLDDDEANLVGPAAAANWVQYRAETGGYDVEVVRDERTPSNSGRRLVFRYEIAGPNAWAIIEEAHGASIENPGFFGMTSFTIGGVPVRAVTHTMAGVPGDAAMGIEFWGPIEQQDRVLDAILAVGAQHGMRRGGAFAYYTGAVESGYNAQPTPAIYSDPELASYRRWLPANGYEGTLVVGGSYRSDIVDDYYVSPYDFGYGHLVRFDHDFVGRDALERRSAEPHRRKVWLRWSDDDVTRVYASSLFGGAQRAKFLETPLGRYNRVQVDTVLAGDRPVGISTMAGYTVNIGGFASVALLDEEHVHDGDEVEVLWGEEDGGTAKQAVERHVQTTIRATVHTRPLVG